MILFFKNYLSICMLCASAGLAYGAAGEGRGVLELHDQEITQSIGRAVYEQFADELRGKSQEELNRALTRVSGDLTFDRSKIIALVYADADPNFRSKLSSSVLLTAIGKDDISLVRFLCTRKADPNLSDNVDMFAFWGCKSIAMLDVCVSFGADVTKINSDGQNILHYVRPKKEVSPFFVERLLKLGAPVTQIDRYGYTALARLVLHGQLDCDDLAKKCKEIAYLFLAFGAETHHRIRGAGHAGKTAAALLRNRGQRLYEQALCKKTCFEIAHTIDRYPLRSLQEYIIRCAILDARHVDPRIAEPAQELVEHVKEPGSILYSHNKEIFDRCFDELTPREETKSVSLFRTGAFWSR